MRPTVFVRPRGEARWCRYRSAVPGDRITTVCRAAIAQGEPLELADDVPTTERCAACEATRQLECPRTEWSHRLAMRGAELDLTCFAREADDAPGPDSEAIRAALAEHEDLLGDDVRAFDHLNDLREVDE